jgi:hypothetical protein
MASWFFYNIVLPLAGIPLVMLGLWTIKSEKKFLTIIRDGQLCFFSTTLSAGAIHDFIPINQSYQDVVIGFLPAVIVVCDFVYGFAFVSDKIPDLDVAHFEKRIGIISVSAVILCVAVIGGARFHWGMM